MSWNFHGFPQFLQPGSLHPTFFLAHHLQPSCQFTIFSHGVNKTPLNKQETGSKYFDLIEYLHSDFTPFFNCPLKRFLKCVAVHVGQTIPIGSMCGVVTAVISPVHRQLLRFAEIWKSTQEKSFGCVLSQTSRKWGHTRPYVSPVSFSSK